MTLKTPDWQGSMLAIALTISMALGTCAANSLSGRQEKAEQRLTTVEQQSAQRGERLATLEAQAKQNADDHKEIKALLRELVQQHVKKVE